MAIQTPNRAQGEPEPPESAFYRGEHHRRFPCVPRTALGDVKVVIVEHDTCLHGGWLRMGMEQVQ